MLLISLITWIKKLLMKLCNLLQKSRDNMMIIILCILTLILYFLIASVTLKERCWLRAEFAIQSPQTGSINPSQKQLKLFCFCVIQLKSCGLLTSYHTQNCNSRKCIKIHTMWNFVLLSTCLHGVYVIIKSCWPS